MLLMEFLQKQSKKFLMKIAHLFQECQMSYINQRLRIYNIQFVVNCRLLSLIASELKLGPMLVTYVKIYMDTNMYDDYVWVSHQVFHTFKYSLLYITIKGHPKCYPFA